MTPEVALEALAARLRAAGCVFAEEEAALLVEDAPSDAVLEGRAARRCAGEPLEQVLGWAAFAGLRVSVVPGVFVPRRRSELLAREAAALAAAAQETARTSGGRAAVVVDLCCGTGALGLAVATAVPGVEVHAADVDPVATACAAHNLREVAGGAGDRVHTGDLFDALPDRLRGRVDVLVVNAPYVPRDEVALMPPEARDHEPLVALDGGTDGLDVQRRVAAGARAWLAPGGALLVETSARQAAGTERACRAGGLAPRTVHDLELEAVVVVALA